MGKPCFFLFTGLSLFMTDLDINPIPLKIKPWSNSLNDGQDSLYF